MRIAVTGATGNVGSALLRVLEADPGVTSIVGIARRTPPPADGKVTWQRADVATDDLRPVFDGADAVVHLAWLIQPSRDRDATTAVNVGGSRRVFEAAEAAGAAIVHASSVGAYSPGPKDRAVDESWATGGIETSFYSRDKVAAERALDAVDGVRTVRLRPGLIFQADAAAEIRRYFAGPLLPQRLVRPGLLRVVPRLQRLVIQAVHSSDVAHAYRLVIQAVHSSDVAHAYRLAATDRDAHGAFNIAAEPVLNPETLARALGAVQVPLPVGLVRALADLTWKLRLQPTPAGWLDLALGVPVMDVGRAQRELGWTPKVSATDALRELLQAMSEGRGGDTPVLSSDVSRADELRTGVGGRNP